MQFITLVRALGWTKSVVVTDLAPVFYALDDVLCSRRVLCATAIGKSVDESKAAFRGADIAGRVTFDATFASSCITISPLMHF